MPIFFALQPFRGVIALDSLTLYDHGGVTAFDAARCRGDGAGDVACCQHHRETYRQGGEQCQEDLFYILFHCAEFLVFLFCTDLTDNTDIFARTQIFTECHGIFTQLHPCCSVLFRVRFIVLYGYYGFYGYFCSNTDFHGVSRNLCSPASV